MGVIRRHTAVCRGIRTKTQPRELCASGTLGQKTFLGWVILLCLRKTLQNSLRRFCLGGPLIFCEDRCRCADSQFSKQTAGQTGHPDPIMPRGGGMPSEGPAALSRAVSAGFAKNYRTCEAEGLDCPRGGKFFSNNAPGGAEGVISSGSGHCPNALGCLEKEQRHHMDFRRRLQQVSITLNVH